MAVTSTVVFILLFAIRRKFFDLWSMYFTLQLQVYIHVVYDVPMPAQTLLFLRHLREVIEFEFVNMRDYLGVIETDGRFWGLLDQVENSVIIPFEFLFVAIVATMILGLFCACDQNWSKVF